MVVQVTSGAGQTGQWCAEDKSAIMSIRLRTRHRPYVPPMERTNQSTVDEDHNLPTNQNLSDTSGDHDSTQSKTRIRQVQLHQPRQAVGRCQNPYWLSYPCGYPNAKRQACTLGKHAQAA